jgi:hypothetical protein
MKWKFWQSDPSRLDRPVGDELPVLPNPIPPPPEEAIPVFRGVGGLEIGSDVRALEGDLEDDPRKEEVFDDEIDPAWKDPDTAE